jgi:pimeloyl-ACP methyl ester carboxylesterase
MDMPELRTAQDFRETPARTIAAAGAQLAYRELGPRAGAPLALLRHLGANPDNWRPCIVDGLAQDRRVITVDNRSVGGLPAPLTPLRTITHRMP